MTTVFRRCRVPAAVLAERVVPACTIGADFSNHVSGAPLSIECVQLTPPVSVVSSCRRTKRPMGHDVASSESRAPAGGLDSFVNSQEWTLSRSVPDIRLHFSSSALFSLPPWQGIVGSLSSGKSALVHRYLTGSYMQDESPEGGRFKKEIVVDGHSYLLLIRDEGGPPELQSPARLIRDCGVVRLFPFHLRRSESYFICRENTVERGRKQNYKRGGLTDVCSQAPAPPRIGVCGFAVDEQLKLLRRKRSSLGPSARSHLRFCGRREQDPAVLSSAALVSVPCLRADFLRGAVPFRAALGSPQRPSGVRHRDELFSLGEEKKGHARRRRKVEGRRERESIKPERRRSNAGNLGCPCVYMSANGLGQWCRDARCSLLSVFPFAAASSISARSNASASSFRRRQNDDVCEPGREGLTIKILFIWRASFVQLRRSYPRTTGLEDGVVREFAAVHSTLSSLRRFYSLPGTLCSRRRKEGKQLYLMPRATALRAAPRTVRGGCSRRCVCDVSSAASVTECLSCLRPGYFERRASYSACACVVVLFCSVAPACGRRDAISESNPRVIDDSRARKLASDLKRCSYYETCATYGFNVERVFQDACQRIVQMRMASTLTPNNSRPSTPVGIGATGRAGHFGAASNGYAREQAASSASSTANATAQLVNSYNALHGGGTVNQAATNLNQTSLKESHLRQIRDCIATGTSVQREIQKFEKGERASLSQASEAVPPPASSATTTTGNNRERPEFVTPCSTPTTARKTRRRSNLFTPLKKADEEKRLRNGEMGSGRVIPVRQGYLYKKSIKALNKEWKKKYVTLTSDGRLTYHPSLHDYMDDVHGKEIPLMHTTVKIPGQKPRGSRAAGSTPHVNDLTSDVGTLSLAGGVPFFKYKEPREREFPASFEPADAPHGSNPFFAGMLNGSETQLIPAVPNTNPMLSKLETPNVKKRHRRMKSTGAKNFEAMEDSDGYEFIIVSLDNKQWQFEASNGDGRLNSLVDSASSVQAIRTTVPGNSHCADCDTPQPDWASLNLGTLICIECSGIHRNLGSHISRVRSLDLDDWPSEHVAVMMALGNMASNCIWEGGSARGGFAKPGPHSSRDEKERWIRAKYEQRDFLAALPSSSGPTAAQLREAVCRGDVRQVALLLAHASPQQHELVNAPTSSRDSRTPLHVAAGLGNLAMVQLLLWNNANAKAVDSEGRTPLVYAKNSNFSEIYELLLHSGGPDPNQLATTLSRRRGSLSKRSDVFDKLPASII
ncbi:hypothetical protein HPB48_004676 [Haemaphysalis longicornis]|uniref:Uncharacterized protein n=1 Tax=Haemaphysalis longicornis TaxID=44386 RepID=A0A9J6G1J2_HAELO|nr:hypothetical protein HPB48_004676 [Haemaphysalis longicornis]